MPHSPLVGTDKSPRAVRGRDTDALGPSDNTDSGSDIAGLDEDPGGDPMLPVDVAMRDDHPHGLVSPSTAGSWGGDAAGTGERRSAGGDAGPEAADIGVDRVFTPGADDDVEDDDALAALDDATGADDAMDVGDGDEDDDEVDAAMRDAREDAVRAGEPEAGRDDDVDDLDDDLDEAESARIENHGSARGGGAGSRRDDGPERPGRH